MVALQEAFPPLDRDERNKEEAQVVVQAFAPGRGQPTPRAGPRLIIDLDLPRLYPANEDEGTPPPVTRFALNHVFVRSVCQEDNLPGISWSSGLKSGEEWLS